MLGGLTFYFPPGESTIREDGTLETFPNAFVSVLQFNSCTNAFLYGSGVTFTPSFAIDGGLNGGSRQGSVQVCGFSSDSSSVVCFPVSFDLTWTATSDLSRENDVFQTRSGNSIVVSHFNGSARLGYANGTITDANRSWVQRNSQAGLIGFALANEIEIN